ncbi:MAG TPA: hypothetical protein VGC17_03090 [Lactovum miscens]|uniref:hypothetical protein n=1 Tax=Lactovum miscens TaxID=190387 RepID=UPI002ED77D9D
MVDKLPFIKDTSNSNTSLDEKLISTGLGESVFDFPVKSISSNQIIDALFAMIWSVIYFLVSCGFCQLIENINQLLIG